MAAWNFQLFYKHFSNNFLKSLFSTPNSSTKTAQDLVLVITDRRKKVKLVSILNLHRNICMYKFHLALDR